MTIPMLPQQPSRTWFRIRVAILLTVLAFVLLYAWHDRVRRTERVAWERTLDVAFVVVREGAVSDSAVSALRAETSSLESALARQLVRYRTSPARPFSFVWYGPVDLEAPLPSPPEDGLVGAARHAWQLRNFTTDIDARAKVPSRGFDARLYLVARPPSRSGFVEGISEHGGRVGVALAELDESNVPLTLFVAAHELFHTLGATDRYDANGRTLIPDGLAEPDKVPLYPQLYVEIMARNRPLDAEQQVPPRSLDELWVGASTAAEIGWSRVP
ncbi:MAG TPA: hypothetical protein VGK73_19630 [Polyangiaceae bacterium]